MEVVNQVLEIIRPETMGDLFIYAIFLLTVLNLAFIPEKNDLPVYLHYAVILMCILDLLREGAALPIQGTGDTGFFTFLLHIGMFIAPMLSAGAIRLPKGKRGTNYARMIAVLITLIALLYAVGSFAEPALFYDDVIVPWS
jgi:hypothetical protein